MYSVSLHLILSAPIFYSEPATERYKLYLRQTNNPMAAEKKKTNPLDAWVERDLTTAVRNGEIQPAFQVAAVCEQLTEIIHSGKNPVISGDSGIGKTAIINGMGETIHCRSTIIIATTNEGAEVYRGQTIGFSPLTDLREMDHAVDRSLDKRFRFEFLNRFDHIVHFHPLSREHIRQIAMREIARLQDRVGMKSRKLNLEIDESVLDWLTVNGFDADYGARFLRRIIERHVTTVLADLIVREHLTKTTSVALSVRKDRIVASVQKRSGKKKSLPGDQKNKTGAEKPVDTETLRTCSRDLLKRAASLLDDLDRKKKLISELLETINSEGFWESEKKSATIEQFRTLDVTIRIEERLSKPLHFLGDVLQECEKIDVSPTRLSRAYDRASEALTQWTERLEDDGIGSAWMIISNQDPLNCDTKWLRQIADMECQWCRRLKLPYDIIACSLHDGELSRLVLELEGPGITSYCAMEQGIHRLKRTGRPDIKVKVEIIPRSEAPIEESGSLQQIKKQTIFPVSKHGTRPGWSSRIRACSSISSEKAGKDFPHSLLTRGNAGLSKPMAIMTPSAFTGKAALLKIPGPVFQPRTRKMCSKESWSGSMRGGRR
jgi:hypothetical protein